MPNTANFNWNLPDVGGDFDGWGAEINVTFQEIDTKAKELADAVDLLAPLADPTFTGVITGNLTGDVTGNADTATALAAARAFSIAGDVVATAIDFDGSGAVALQATLSPALRTEIDGKQKQATISASAPSGGVNGDVWYQI